MGTDIKIFLVMYILAFILSAVLFVLKRFVVIGHFNNRVVIDYISLFILSLRLVCISSLPIVNIVYTLYQIFDWNECINELKEDFWENDYRLC